MTSQFCSRRFGFIPDNPRLNARFNAAALDAVSPSSESAIPRWKWYLARSAAQSDGATQRLDSFAVGAAAKVHPPDRVLDLRPRAECLPCSGCQAQRLVELSVLGVQPRQVVGGYASRGVTGQCRRLLRPGRRAIALRLVDQADHRQGSGCTRAPLVEGAIFVGSAVEIAGRHIEACKQLIGLDRRRRRNDDVAKRPFCRAGLSRTKLNLCQQDPQADIGRRLGQPLLDEHTSALGRSAGKLGGHQTGPRFSMHGVRFQCAAQCRTRGRELLSLESQPALFDIDGRLIPAVPLVSR